MHDALMYITPAQVLDLFEKSPELRSLYCSLVIPAESLAKIKSINPDLYTFSILGTDLLYFLEGKKSGSYQQPLNANQWLTWHSISNAKTTLSVCLLDTHGPFHSILISRAAPKSDVRRFTFPEAYLLPSPTDIEFKKNRRLVPKEVYDALFNYVRAVRTLRVTDPTGFIRTQRNKPEYSWVHAAAWEYLADFALKTSAYRPIHRFPLHNSLWSRLTSFAINNEGKLKALASLTFSNAVACALNWKQDHQLSLLRLFGRNLVNDSRNLISRCYYRMPVCILF